MHQASLGNATRVAGWGLEGYAPGWLLAVAACVTTTRTGDLTAWPWAWAWAWMLSPFPSIADAHARTDTSTWAGGNGMPRDR